jgi:hypothetical protein
MQTIRARLIACAVGSVFAACAPSRPPVIEPAPRPSCPLVPAVPTAPFEVRTDDGTLLGQVDRGDAFVLRDGRLEFSERLYDANWFERTFVVEDCRVYRTAGDGQRYEVRRAWREGFEGLSHVRELFTPARAFTSLTLQSPAARDVPAYVALQNCLIAGTCDFRDSRIDPLTADVAEGTRALRFTSSPRAPDMITGKASIETTLAHFVRGDDVWVAFSVRVVEGRPLTFFDLESDIISLGPGPRVIWLDDGTLAVELKWADKPTYRQPAASRVQFPTGRWVRLTVHYTLAETPQGVIELWQDAQQVLSVRGRTLPVPDSVLARIELGITAHSDPTARAVVDLDDLEISTTPIAPRAAR